MKNEYGARGATGFDPDSLAILRGERKQVAAPVPPAQALHRAALECISDLAKYDPARDTTAGRVLDRLASAVEAYEKATLPPPFGGAWEPTTRMCCNADCDWAGKTDRMLGSVGPLCPECGEVTEPR